MRRHLIYSASILGLMAAAPVAAFAGGLPSGGTVASGAVNITQTSPSQMTITQTSKTGVINWNDFSIGKGQSVQFLNGNGATLNRVLGASPSRIDGALTATGSVYLMNGYGVIIGKTGSINVGQSFIATSLGLSDKAFTDGGDLTFTGGSGGSVINLGAILAAGGDVVLAGPNVTNSGAINAPQGAVGLLGGSTVLLRSNMGDTGKFVVWGGAQGVAVTHDGEISAAEVELRSDLGDIRAGAVGLGGNITATGVSAVDGKIFLVAQQGTLTAHDVLQATKSDGSGGFVETSGRSVDFSGVSVKGANWLIDPTDLTINTKDATSIDAALNLGATVTLDTASTPPIQTSDNSAVTVTSSGAAGNIYIKAPMNWSKGALVLKYNGSLNVSSDVTIDGNGRIEFDPSIGSGDGFGFNRNANGFEGHLTVNNPTNDTVKINGGSLSPISSASELQNITSGNIYYLTKDIVIQSAGLNVTNWSPIGDVAGKFSGKLEGMGHSITGLVINNRSADHAGLFGYITNPASGTSLLRNFSISGHVIGRDYVGILAAQSEGEFSDILISGSAKGGNNVGGAVGELIWTSGAATHGYINNLYSNALVEGVLSVGGLIGSAGSGNGLGISNSTATGKVTGQSGSEDVGGLVGLLHGGSISGSSASGDVSGGKYVGGLVGATSAGTSVTTSSASGAVSGDTSVGGLAGQIAGSLSNGTSTSGVTGTTNVGGLVGQVTLSGMVGTSSATGAVTGNSGSTDVGGLVGLLSGGSVSGSSASGDVSGGTYVGGLVGATSAGTSVTSSSASGAVSGDTSVGGLAGQIAGSLSGGSATGSVEGASKVGALVGTLFSNATIVNSRATGAASGSTYVGGLVGDTNDGSTVYSSWALGKVTGVSEVGGLVGFNGGSIFTSRAAGNVVGTLNVGGLVGSNGSLGFHLSSIISNSIASGDVSGLTNIGGLVGHMSGPSSFISVSMATGAVAGTTYVGGLVGQAYLGRVDQSISTGSVSGSNYVGGFIGADSGSYISESYSIGSVLAPTGATAVGGFLGSAGADTISAAYWNTETSGRLTDGGATGLTTSQLQSGLPTGFSSAWATGPGLYPYLTALFTNPTAVSGRAYGSQGVPLVPTASNQASVTAYANGGALGTASVGADGSYYMLLNGMTLTSTTPIGGILSIDSAKRPDGLSYTENPNLVGGSVTGFNLTSGLYSFNTSATSYSALTGNSLVAAFGAANLTAPAAALPSKQIDLVANQGFTVDQPLYATRIDITTNGGGLTVNQPINASVISLTANSGALTVNQPITANATTITLTTFAGPINLNSSVNAPLLAAAINSAGAINASGDIHTVDLSVNSVGGASFNNPANTFQFLDALTNTGGGSVILADSWNLALTGAINTGAASGVFTSPGSITLGPGATVSSSAGGTSLSLQAGGAFINYAGATALSTPNGRWLVYSSAPANDTFNGLNSNTNPVWNTAAGGPVTAAGNRYVFAYRPTPIIRTLNDTKVYGSDATSQIQADYAITVEPGVAGAYLADTPAIALSGAPTIISPGSAVRASVAGGPYTLSVAPGSALPINGYLPPILDPSGVLTVTQRPLVIGLVGSVAKSSDGSPSATLTPSNFSVSGQVSGDAILLNLPSSGAFDTVLSGSGKSITVNGITLTGPDSGNYSFPATVSAPIGTVYSPGADPPLPRPKPPNLISILDSVVGDQLETATDERNADVPLRASMRSKSERAAQYDLTVDNAKQKKAQRHPATETGNGDLQYSGGGPQ